MVQGWAAVDFWLLAPTSTTEAVALTSGSGRRVNKDPVSPGPPVNNAPCGKRPYDHELSQLAEQVAPVRLAIGRALRC